MDDNAPLKIDQEVFPNALTFDYSQGCQMVLAEFRKMSNTPTPTKGLDVSGARLPDPSAACASGWRTTRGPSLALGRLVERQGIRCSVQIHGGKLLGTRAHKVPLVEIQD